MIESQDHDRQQEPGTGPPAEEIVAQDLARRQFVERRVMFSFLSAMVVSVGVLFAAGSPLLPGPHPDAIHYMEAGRSWAETGTFRVPMASWNAPDSLVALSHYPPGYPLLIGGVMKATGVRADVAVLWLEALGGGATVGLSFWIGSGLGGLVGGLGAAVVVGLLPAFVLLHLGMWSEPLFLPLVLLVMMTGARSRRAALLLGLIAGVGTLIRYIGVALAGYGAVDSLRGSGSVRERMVRGMFAALPSALVMGIWSLMVDSGGEEIRSVRMYGDLWATLFYVRHIPEALLLPLEFHRQPGMYWFGLVALVLPALGFWALARLGGARGSAFRGATRNALIYLGLYTTVLVAARLLADPFIPFDDRLLLPGLLPLIVLWGSGSGVLVREGGRGKSGRVVGVLTLIWLLVIVRSTAIAIPVHQKDGLYYTHRSWLTSDLVFLVELNRDRYPIIYSNDPGMVFFHSARVAQKLPTRYGDAEGFRRHFEENPGMIVIFRSQDPRHMLEGGVGGLLGLEPNYIGWDGAAFLPGVEGMIEINRPSRSNREEPQADSEPTAQETSPG